MSVYNSKKRLQALEWWNNLSSLEQSEFSRDTPIAEDGLYGSQIEDIHNQEIPQDAKFFEKFEDFSVRHPYKPNLIYTEEHWNEFLFETWTNNLICV